MGRRAGNVNTPTETRMQSTEAQNTFGTVIDRAWDGERIVVARFDRDRAVILGLRDYERLRALEIAAA